jgi:hypothetical protein
MIVMGTTRFHLAFASENFQRGCQADLALAPFLSQRPVSSFTAFARRVMLLDKARSPSTRLK